MTAVAEPGGRRVVLRVLLGTVLLGLAGALLAPMDAARACIVVSISHRPDTAAEHGFRERLNQSGLDCQIQSLTMDDVVLRLPALVAQARALQPDLIFTQTTVVTLAVVGKHDATDVTSFIRDTPVVFALVSDPERAGLVPPRPDSKAPLYSRRNLTGARHVVSHRVRLEAMRSFVPLQRLAVAYDGASNAQRQMVEDMARLGEELGIEMIFETALDKDGKRDPAQFGAMLDAIAAASPDLLYFPPSNFFGSHGRELMDGARARELPTFCGVETYIPHGCLAGLVSPFFGVGDLAGVKAGEILRGEAQAGDIPIETLPRFSFIVNMPVSRELEVYPSIQLLSYSYVVEEPTEGTDDTGTTSP